MKYIKQYEEYRDININDENFILNIGDKVFYQEYSWQKIDINQPIYKIIDRDGHTPNISGYEIERLIEPELYSKHWVDRHQLIFIPEHELSANKYNL